MPRSVVPVIVALILASTLAPTDSPQAQYQSTVDTMRIVVAPFVSRGQEIDVDIHLRVVDTLGAFAYRLRYDTLVFEPVQDTFLLQGDTVVGIIAYDLHPGILDQFAGSVREPGVITFLGADLDFDTSSLFLPGSWPTVRMKWRVLPGAILGAIDIYFENDSVLPATWNAFADWYGENFRRPVFGNASTTITCPCECRADPALCDGNLDVLDVVMTIQIAFGGAEAIPDPNPLCPVTRTDVTCDGATDVLDVIQIINVAFRGADPTTTFCNPCEPE